MSRLKLPLKINLLFGNSQDSGDTQPITREADLPSMGIWGLTLLAAIIVTIVRCQSHWLPWLIVLQNVISIAFVVGFLGLRYRFRDRWREHQVVEQVATAASGFLMVAGVWIFDLVSRTFWDVGEAFECRLIASLQQLAMLFCLSTRNARWREIAFACNLAIVIFSAAISQSPQVVWIAAFFLIATGWCMLGEHWQRLKPALSSGKTESLLTVKMSPLLLVAVVLLMAGLIQPQNTWYTLRGFLPTSGGEGLSDAYARSGIGDGEQLVGGMDQADSFGPVETDLFLESNLPTLYDAFNDIYGEPKLKAKNMERTIGIDSENFRQNHQKLDQSSDAKQGLSTRREVPRESTQRGSRLGTEVLQVVGSTPLHLAVDRFEDFDGETWWKAEKDYCGRTVALVSPHGKPWFSIPRRVPEWEVPGRQHQLRFINYNSPCIPMPPHLKQWHVDKIDRADFFDWTSDDHLIMAGRDRIPSMTIVHLNSSGHRPMMLEPVANPRSSRLPLFDRDVLGEDPDSSLMLREREEIANRIREYAVLYGSKEPRGWFEIQGVIKRLREDFTLSPATQRDDSINTASHETSDILGFLNRQSGPDYLFATTAALILREMGYPTRLVTGYYARAENYDSAERLNRVQLSDVHAWLEVRIDDQRWILLEPTPGYEDTAAVWTWGDRFRLAFFVGVQFLKSNWLSLALLAFSGWVMMRVRRLMWDRMICFWYSIRLKLKFSVHAGHLSRLAESRLASIQLKRPLTMSREQFLARTLFELLPDSLNSRSVLSAISAHWYRRSAQVQSEAENREVNQAMLFLVKLHRSQLKQKNQGWQQQIATSRTKVVPPCTTFHRSDRSSKNRLSRWNAISPKTPSTST